MDATSAFEDVGHSSSAYEMLKDFFIGDLVESKDQPNEKVSPCQTKCCSTTKSTNDACKTSSCQ